MAIRLSTALQNFLLAQGSFNQAFNGGTLEVRTGFQPASANNAPTGTKLVTFTSASAAWTAETPSVGSVELTGGAAGSINTVKIDGDDILDAPVVYANSLGATALALADAINRSALNNDFDASVTGNKVELTTRPGRAAQYASAVVASTATTITTNDTNCTSGTDAVNGLLFDLASGGILAKRIAQIWSGVAIASGTAGWFRLLGPVADPGTNAPDFLRLDGSIASSGGNLTMSPLTMTQGATQTLASFNPTIPAEY